MSSTTYATAEDVADRWRPLSNEEAQRADTLAEDASRMIRRRWPTIDTRVLAGELEDGDLRMVVCAMVKRALLIGEEGVTWTTDMAGPFQQARRYENPMGGLFLKADEIALLSESGQAGIVRSVRVTTE